MNTCGKDIKPVRVGIYGYGRLGHGTEKAVLARNGLSLVGIFTRRNPDNVTSPYSSPIYPSKDVLSFVGRIDVMIICSSSFKNLDEDTPFLADYFSVIDSFDIHKKAKNHYLNVDLHSKLTGHTALVSCGWDPGLFSLQRALFTSIVPGCNLYTFWGPGVSEGHSSALKSLDGVADAVEYTIPKKDALARARAGFSVTGERLHQRHCFVLKDKFTEENSIIRRIKEVPDYFKGEDVEVSFIDKKEMAEKSSSFPHGGCVIASVREGESGNALCLETRISLPSNPDFTGSILASYVPAVARLNSLEIYGAKTLLDIPISYLSDGCDLFDFI